METQTTVLKWSLIIGIVIVLNLFFNYSLSLIYKNPVYEAFCPVSQVNEAINTKDQCLSVGGQWTANNTMDVNGKTIPATKDIPAGYCNAQFTCGNDYNAAQKVYDRNVFITLVILGAICVAIGNFFSLNILLSIASSLAGVFSFIIASMRYWSSANDLIKVIILAIALAILVWVAMKKFNNN